MFHEDWYPDHELALVVDLVDVCRGHKGVILEIGSWEGKSTIALANRCFPERLQAIDTWLGSPSEAANHISVQLASRRDVFEVFRGNIQQFTRGNVDPHRTDCFGFIDRLEQPIKFCHVDAAHDYESVRRTLQVILPKLATGGVLCGHDYLNAPGVARAVREVLPHFDFDGNIWWYRSPREPTAAMIYDCFLFRDEFELLELRLRELAGVVDHFVLVEASRTFTGRPKQLSFHRFAHLFRKYEPQIIYVGVSDDITVGGAWERERFQRDAIVRGLTEARSNDIVLISDVDEMPSRTVVRDCRSLDHPVAMNMALHYYWLNCRLTIPWSGTIALPYGQMRSPEIDRNRRGTFELIPDGGWHFSYLGGAQRISEKIRSFSHSEFDRPPYNQPRWIEQSLAHGTDLFGRNNAGFPPEFVDVFTDPRYSGAVRWAAQRHPYLLRPLDMPQGKVDQGVAMSVART